MKTEKKNQDKEKARKKKQKNMIIKNKVLQ